MKQLFQYNNLKSFVESVLQKAGLDAEKSENISRILIEGDLLGHRTHGLQLLASYVSEIENGKMSLTDEIEILNQSRAAETWDGHYLSGTWLVEKAIERATWMAERQGTGTVVIQKSHHIACLAAYLEKVARQNLVVIIASSDPRNKTVAPFGGLNGVYSPNPLAMGIPTNSDPIMIDVSMSTTSNAFVAKANRNNELLPYPWLQDNQGNVTNDPKTFFEEPPSTLLPLGNQDLGYKGFALGIMIEVLTNALCGFGRNDNPARWGGTVFVQIIDPKAFAGTDFFLKEIEYFIEQCKNSRAINDSNPIRMPGERGLKLKEFQLKNGVELLPETISSLFELSTKFKIPLNTI